MNVPQVIFIRDLRNIKKAEIKVFQTFLVVQWVRICLTVQGIQVQSLVQEDSTFSRAINPMHHNHGSLHALGPASCSC